MTKSHEMCALFGEKGAKLSLEISAQMNSFSISGANVSYYLAIENDIRIFFIEQAYLEEFRKKMLKAKDFEFEVNGDTLKVIFNEKTVDFGFIDGTNAILDRTEVAVAMKFLNFNTECDV